MWLLLNSFILLLAYAIQNSALDFLRITEKSLVQTMEVDPQTGIDFQRERNEKILRRSERQLIRRNVFKWSYNDRKTGYSNWPKMLKSCGGSQQSPVDVDTDDTLKSSFLKPMVFHGYDKPLKNAVILNNGHTVLVKTEKNSNPPFIRGGGLSGKYTFRQLHFHWGSSNNKGSEHRIDGKTYPAELHIVHEKNKGKGDLAILAVFLEISKRNNPELEPIIASLSKVSVPGPTVSIKKSFPLTNLLPDDLKHYYRYVGSLTTPPCTEGVVWTVLAKPVRIGQHQLEAFRKLRTSSISKHFLSDNFRPPQELHQRIVWESITNNTSRVSHNQRLAVYSDI